MRPQRFDRRGRSRASIAAATIVPMNMPGSVVTVGKVQFISVPPQGGGILVQNTRPWISGRFGAVFVLAGLSDQTGIKDLSRQAAYS